MELALVIPTRDDHADLLRLLGQAARSGAVAEIVVVDDASDPPLDARVLAEAARPVPVTLLPGAGRGAGAARNRGLEAVTAGHVLFFDADDELTAEIAPLRADLAGREFDICQVRYADTRLDWRGGWGQPPFDEGFWSRAGLSDRALAGPVDAGRRALLAQTANYPWNKVYRTAFLRAHGLRCSETPVHNDIALHWLSLDAATTVLASGRVVARHHVRPGGGRLTNRSGIERLSVFGPLGEVADALLPDRPLALPFLRFTGGLLGWVRDTLDPALRPRFDRRTGLFLSERLAPGLFDRIVARDPVLARRLLGWMALGRAA